MRTPEEIKAVVDEYKTNPWDWEPQRDDFFIVISKTEDKYRNYDHLDYWIESLMRIDLGKLVADMDGFDKYEPEDCTPIPDLEYMLLDMEKRGYGSLKLFIGGECHIKAQGYFIDIDNEPVDAQGDGEWKEINGDSANTLYLAVFKAWNAVRGEKK